MIESDEQIEGVFRFSELALVVTDRRIVKHIGAYLWDPDYEEYPYSQVTGLEFEEGSVATSVVISVDGRPQRIKAPSGEAEVLRRALTTALFSYYEVDSLEELNATLAESKPETSESTESSGSLSSDIELDDTIDPLVTPDDNAADDISEPPTEATKPESGSTSESPGNTTEPLVEKTEPSARTTESSTAAADTEPGDRNRTHTAAGDTGAQTTADQSADTGTPDIDPDDIEAMKSRLDTLTEVAKRQNTLLKQQQETITQLVDELKRQR
ncbi:hypothetical protein [Halovenus salina]|uniref:PH domain-containing protein n=1 Tax=Halovenus salina TaxID=1510225 RepID=A0ABD5W236_9EURY